MNDLSMFDYYFTIISVSFNLTNKNLIQMFTSTTDCDINKIYFNSFKVQGLFTITYMW